jgi:NADH-quinone oxidoreductase subunit C
MADLTEPEERYGCAVTLSAGDEVLHPSRDQYIDVVKALADDGFHLIVDVCAVDYLTYGEAGAERVLPAAVAPERFEVVVHLTNLQRRSRIRLRVQVPEADPELASLFEIFPGCEAMEREVFDLFGVGFAGHPDLTRILMPEDWVGHPLRKDYEVGRIPVQFKGAPS